MVADPAPVRDIAKNTRTVPKLHDSTDAKMNVVVEVIYSHMYLLICADLFSASNHRLPGVR